MKKGMDVLKGSRMEAGVFIDIIFGLNLITLTINFSVALITLISLFLYGLNWFKLTAKLHRE